MSRLDPSIYNNIKPFESPSILESQAKVMQLGDMMQRRELQKQQLEAGQAQADLRRQELSDKKVKADKLARMQKAIGESGGDFLKAVPALRNIDNDMTNEWLTEYDKHLKSEADKTKVEFDNHKAASEQIVSQLSAIKGNPAQKTFALKSLIGAGILDPNDPEEAEVIKQISEYDPANPESVLALDGFISANTDAKTKLEQQQADNVAKHQTEQDRLEKIKIGANTKTFNGHEWQFNSETGKYDIDLGIASKSASGRSNLSPDTMVVNGKPERVLVGTDPDDPDNFQKVFLKGVDVTDKASFYKAPPSVSATVQIANAAKNAVEGLDEDTGYALDRATNNLTPSKKLNVINTVTRASKNGNTKQVRDTIKQAAKESESPAVQANITGRREMLKSLSDIQELFKGVPQNLISGTIEDVARKLGTTKDPKLVKLATRLTTLNQAYRKAVTGAQFSQQESAEYTKVLPSTKNTEIVNTAEIEALMDSVKAQDAVFWDNKLGPGWTDYQPEAKAAAAAPAKPAVSTDKAPAGIDQADWDHMDPKDKALWKK